MNLENPYEPLTGGQWLRGNLHTHTTRSDGRRPPQEVIDDYAARGYDFLMLSDHDIYTSPEELAGLDARGMILIPGNEVSKGGPHLLHVDAASRVEPDPQRQAVFDEIKAGGAGFAVACHPNWQASFDHIPMQQLTDWSAYAGIEIFNGVIEWSAGSSYATNKWDLLLAGGRRVWGFANDDSHSALDVGKGWNVVYAESRDRNGIVEALTKGRFYASTGVVIHNIRVAGNRIRIETENAERIVARYHTTANRPKRLAQVDSQCLEVEVPPEAANYVRFECWGRGETFAWTQPFYIS